MASFVAFDTALNSSMTHKELEAVLYQVRWHQDQMSPDELVASDW
jgi:hypothetical protein